MGISKGYNKVEEFGLDLTKSDQYYGLALGGLDTVRLLWKWLELIALLLMEELYINPI
ncbi:hypothetical protein GCM10025880_68600 [Methylorubrum aminovorans]|nr:hypothetical protein GCM10025880_68600 [Methylorubrum aminovorans]